MLPSNRYMDPYTQPLPNQVPYFRNDYRPSWGVIPPTKHDRLGPSPLYGPWSYGSSFVYPNPTGCHGCCNHGYPPVYPTFRPAHAYPPPPIAHCYHGPYPPYAEAYPPYHAPPHYTMEQPRYEFDKDTRWGHCCGCANHLCKQKEGKGVRIEEHEPDSGKKESDSLAPVRLENNYPYPFLWVPPEYLTNTDCKKSSDFEPKVWNGWYPFGMRNDKENESEKNSESLKQVGDVKDNQIQRIDDKKAQLQFPFPYFWTPGFKKLEEPKDRDFIESDTSSKTREDQPSKLKMIPVNLPQNGDSGEETEVMGDAYNWDLPVKKTGKAAQLKNIPVMQIEEVASKKSAETESNSEKIDVKQKEQKEKSSLDENLKDKFSSSPSSPKKGSKLPPVCLRVDPLPRRKNGSGTSRPPSSPGGKKASQKSDTTESTPTPLVVNKTSSFPAEQAPPTNRNEEIIPVKDVKVVEAKELEENDKDKVRRGSDQFQRKSDVPGVSDGPALDKSRLREKEHTSDIKEATPQDKGEMCEKDQASESKESIDLAKKAIVEERRTKKEISPTEAALLIQSSYRGFEVRRWEPLKKLKQVAKIREQAGEISERIRNLVSTDLQKDGKQRMLIGETIMSLLLQLDTIQGLHPSVRDVRKAVARELVSLQERLDSLGTQNLEVRSHEIPSSSETNSQEVPKSKLDGECAPLERYEMPEQADYQLKFEEQFPERTTEDLSKVDASPSLMLKEGESSLEAMEDDFQKPKEPAELTSVPDMKEDSTEDELYESQGGLKAFSVESEEQLPERPTHDASPLLVIKDEEPSLEGMEDDSQNVNEAPAHRPIESSEPTLVDMKEESTESQAELQSSSVEAMETLAADIFESNVEHLPHGVQGVVDDKADSKEETSEILRDVSTESFRKDEPCELEVELEPSAESSALDDVSVANAGHLPGLANEVQDEVNEKAVSEVDPSELLEEDKVCELKGRESLDMVSDPDSEHLLGKFSQEVQVQAGPPRSGTDQLVSPPSRHESYGVVSGEVDDTESQVVEEQRENDSEGDATCLAKEVPSFRTVEQDHNEDVDHTIKDELVSSTVVEEHNEEVVWHRKEVSVCPPEGSNLEEKWTGVHEQPVLMSPDNMEAANDYDGNYYHENEVPGATKGKPEDVDHIRNDIMESSIMEGENHIGTVEDCQQEQLSIHAPANESKLEEEPIGDEVNNVHIVSEPATLTGLHLPSKDTEEMEDTEEVEEEPIGYEVNNVHIVSEPATLTGLHLPSKDTEEMEDTKEVEVFGVDHKRSSPLEEAEVPDILDLSYEDPCLDGVSSVSESNPSGDDLAKSEAKAGKHLGQEEPGNEAAALNNPDGGATEEKKLLEENEMLREMLGKLLQEGKQQLTVISDLSGRVRDLEKKLTTKKKLRMRRQRAAPASCLVKQRNVRTSA